MKLTQKPKPDTRKKGGRTLTPKQDRFVDLYLETGSFTKAYKGAYAATSEHTATINRNAYAISEIPHVKAAIQKRLEARRTRADNQAAVTTELLTDRLLGVAKAAEEAKQFGPAVQAYMGVGKILGLIIDKLESKNTTRNIAELTDEQLEQIITQAHKSAGKSASSVGSEEPEMGRPH